MLPPAQRRQRPRRPLCNRESRCPEVLRGHSARQVPFSPPDIRPEISLALVRKQDGRDQLYLLVLRLVHQIRQLVQSIQMRDHLERIPLVDQKLLSLRAVVHLLRVF